MRSRQTRTDEHSPSLGVIRARPPEAAERPGGSRSGQHDWASEELPNGPAAAAILASGLGCLALGMITTVAENSKPVLDRLTLLQPVGSLSGKTSFAVLIWLVAWAALHGHWKNKQLR